MAASAIKLALCSALAVLTNSLGLHPARHPIAATRTWVRPSPQPHCAGRRRIGGRGSSAGAGGDGPSVEIHANAERDPEASSVDQDAIFGSNMHDGLGIVDDLWGRALEAEEEPDAHKMNQKNPRMQMFAYLSQPIVEVRIIGLVFLSCLLQAINTLEDLPSGVHRSIDIIDNICVYIFAVEFFLRWWSAGQFRLRYLAKPLVSIDAVAVILPLGLSGLLPIWDFSVMAGVIPPVSLPGWLLSSTTNSALLNLRLLRIIKFQRSLTDETTYMNLEMALGMSKRDVRPYQLQLARVLISIFTLVSVSTGLIYTAEHEVNPDIPDYFTALYFGLTTLTTVGFGDITPVTLQGRMVIGGSILAGAAVIPAQAASLAEAYLDFQNERAAGRPRPEKSEMLGGGRCEKCGAGPHRRDASYCWSCGAPLG